MKSFSFIVSSPDGNRFDGECEKVDLRGIEGDLAIMAGHVPFMTTVQEGKVLLHLTDGTKKEASLSGGLLSVTEDKVILFSGSFSLTEE